MKRIIAMALLFVGVSTALTGCTSEPKGDEYHLKLEFTVTDIFNEQAMVHVAPNFEKVSYYWSAMPKKTYEAAGGDDAIRKEDMDYFNQLAVEEGLTTGAIIGGKVMRGRAGIEIFDLQMNTEYVVYGYALAPDGKKTSGFSKAEFKTINTGLDITKPIHAKTIITPKTPAGMTTVESAIVPETDEVRWLSQIVADSELQSFVGTTGSPMAAFKQIYKETLAYTAETNGVSVREVVSVAGKTRANTQSHRYLRPETKYWVYVASVNAVGEILDFDYKEVTTTPRVWAGGSREAFTVEIEIPDTYIDDMGTNQPAQNMPDPTIDDVSLPGIGQQSVYVKFTPRFGDQIDDKDGIVNTVEPIDPNVVSPEDGAQWMSQWVITENEFIRIAGNDPATQEQNFLEAAVVEDNKWIAGGTAWRSRFNRGMREGLFGNAQQPLPVDTDFRVLVYAYNETYVSRVFQTKFKTLPIADPRTMPFTIYPNPGPDGVWNANGGLFPGGEDDEWGSHNARLGWGAFWSKTAYIPADNLVPFHHHIDEKATFESRGNTLQERIKGSFDAYIARWVASYAGELTTQQVMENLMKYGPKQQNEYQMDENKDYVAWAACFDINGNLYSENPAYVEFRTPAFTPKDIQVDVNYLGYWDGQAISGAMYSEFPFVVIDNMRIPGMNTAFSAGFGNWVVFFAKNTNGRNFSDKEKFSDAWISGVVWNGRGNQKGTDRPLEKARYYMLDYENDWTMITICVDKYAEEYGRVTRLQIPRLARGGGQPASTFPIEALEDASSMSQTRGMANMNVGVEIDDIKMTTSNVTPYSVVFPAAQRLSVLARQGMAPKDFTVQAPTTSDEMEFNPVSADERLKSQAVRFMHRVR